MKILAIETSCDETSAAIIGEADGLPVAVSNIVFSQIDIHKEYGGVVPEVAARSHIEKMIPVLKESLAGAGISLSDLTHIAVTYGPGLIGSLIVGVETAKGLSKSTGLPIIPINHLEGHIYANFLKREGEEKQIPEFPLIVLIVSGGHTMLIYMKDHLSYEVIGKTRDDAAGEAFDKAAKLLSLPYPGGPEISKRAGEGNPNHITFPVIDLTEAPKRNEEGFLVHPEPSLDFSFSGLKTALLTRVRKEPPKSEQDINNLAASFEKTVVDTLTQNSTRAIEKYKPKTFILSGGVAANRRLRESLGEMIKEISPQTGYLIPELNLCTDNAAMIGSAAYFHIKKGTKPSQSFSPEPNLSL